MTITKKLLYFTKKTKTNGRYPLYFLQQLFFLPLVFYSGILLTCHFFLDQNCSRIDVDVINLQKGELLFLFYCLFVCFLEKASLCSTSLIQTFELSSDLLVL